MLGQRSGGGDTVREGRRRTFPRVAEKAVWPGTWRLRPCAVDIFLGHGVVVQAPPLDAWTVMDIPIWSCVPWSDGGRGARAGVELEV